MKKTLSVILSVILVLSFTACKSETIEGNFSIDHSVRKEMADGMYMITDYNKNGQVIRNVWYNADDTIYEWYVTEYNENDNTSISTWYYADGRYRITQYDAAGNNISSTVHNADGTVAEITE